MVRSWCVDTVMLTARRVLGTLIYVIAVRLNCGLRVALVTHALVSAHQVFTGAIAADT